MLFADDTVVPSLLPQEARWASTFSDEFDGERLDTKKWTPHDFGVFIRNHELQAYVEDAFSVQNGVLRITAEEKDREYAGKRQPYTSGMMITKDKFSQKFGYFEIRCRMPKGKGLWPAFWMLQQQDPQPWPPEIDILEYLGHEPKTMHFTIHWKNGKAPNGRESSHQKYTGPDFSDGFHIVGCQWNAKEVKWYLDGKLCHRYEGEGVPQVPMYLMVNLAVGGDWPGSPNSETPFPSVLEVDFVRAYREAE